MQQCRQFLYEHLAGRGITHIRHRSTVWSVEGISSSRTLG